MFIVIVSIAAIGLLARVLRDRDQSGRDRRVGGPSHTARPKPNMRAPVFDPGTATQPAGPFVLEGAARMVDGDTIVFQKTQIRVFGIEAPKLNHRYGQKSKWALARLCKGHKVTVRMRMGGA